MITITPTNRPKQYVLDTQLPYPDPLTALLLLILTHLVYIIDFANTVCVTTDHYTLILSLYFTCHPALTNHRPLKTSFSYSISPFTNRLNISTSLLFSHRQLLIKNQQLKLKSTNKKLKNKN